MGFSLPNLTNCCFCFSIRTGSKIIAFLSLLASILLILQSSLLAVALGYIIGQYDELKDQATFLLVLTAIDLTLQSLQLVMTILLLIGIYKEKPHLLKFYVIIKTVLLALTFILVCVFIAGLNFVYIITNFIVLALHAYWTLVIYSFYKQLIDEKQNSATTRNQPVTY